MQQVEIGILVFVNTRDLIPRVRQYRVVLIQLEFSLMQIAEPLYEYLKAPV